MPSLEERDRRYEALRHAMRERGLDVLVAVADAHHKGNVRYLTDHDIWSQRAYVVVPLEQDPTLIVSMNSQQYWARKRGWIEDVRSAPRPVEAVASLLAERGLARAARIGIGGMTDLMSVGDMRLLTDVLPGTAFEDATTLVQGVRAHKSDEELAGLRESADIADRGFEVFTARARPGVNEHEVVADVEREVRRHGVRDTLILISPGPYLREPSDRVFERDDLTLFSLELAGPSGYWVELGGVCAFTEPGSADARLYACCLDTFERGRQLLRTGARAADVAAALRQTLQAWGYEAGIWGGHGIGLDVGEVPRLVQTDDSTLEAGMTFGFHPHIIDPASGHAAYIADTLLVSESGGVGLSRTARTLHILPSKESSR